MYSAVRLRTGVFREKPHTTDYGVRQLAAAPASAISLAHQFRRASAVPLTHRAQLNYVVTLSLFRVSVTVPEYVRSVAVFCFRVRVFPVQIS